MQYIVVAIITGSLDKYSSFSTMTIASVTL